MSSGALHPAARGPDRDLRVLPKAHLHLHLVGGMRLPTLIELAEVHGIPLPRALTEQRLAGPGVPGGPLTSRYSDGWFRFQRLYDAARRVLRTPADVIRVIREIAEDAVADGAVWVELQVDPSGYAARFDGTVSTVELMCEATRAASRSTGLGMALIVAANRTRHPAEAATLARIAVRFRDAGAVGFGLSNNERAGPAAAFTQAFRIARRGGLISVPHGGEMVGPAAVWDCLNLLGADRIGHGVRAVDDPVLLRRLAAAGTTLEVCPASNVALGVAADQASVPVRRLLNAGVRVVLGADDPLLFASGLTAQYQTARAVHRLDDATLAHLARSSLDGSTAPAELRRSARAAIDNWLRRPVGVAADAGGSA